MEGETTVGIAACRFVPFPELPHPLIRLNYQ